MEEMVCARDWPASKPRGYRIHTTRVCSSRKWLLQSSLPIGRSRPPARFLSPDLPSLQYHERQVKMQRYLFHISLSGSKTYVPRD